MFRRSRPGAETIDPLLARHGLQPADVSPAAYAAMKAMDTERENLLRALEAARASADRDTLTPTYNRRAFMRALHRTMSEVERYKTPAAVLYLDLDGFKAINDGYGHAAGDAVLKAIGKLLVEQVRESDVVGRLGGDEFGVILNRVASEEAHAKAESIAASIDDTPILFAGIAHRVRGSIGVHAIAVSEDPETAIARADEAMYADKRAHSLAHKFAGF